MTSFDTSIEERWVQEPVLGEKGRRTDGLLRALDQCWILHADMRCSSRAMACEAMLWPTSTSASSVCSLRGADRALEWIVETARQCYPPNPSMLR
eukprot:6212411-Pleurochrysis_carterae.AAC.6